MFQLFGAEMEGITKDLFDISGRLKDIDPDYQIYRNYILNRFELWWRGALVLIFPFEKLDERSLHYARKTRRENADETETEIDGQNAEIEAEKQRNIAVMTAKLTDRLLYENNNDN
jgi:hypothetical protein